MSDTPRTDALIATRTASYLDVIDFARTLERELAEAKARYQADESILDSITKEVCPGEPHIEVKEIGASFAKLKSALTAREAEVARLREAAQALVDQLDLIHADERYKAVWTLHQLHHGPYTGPQYSVETLRAALEEKHG